MWSVEPAAPADAVQVLEVTRRAFRRYEGKYPVAPEPLQDDLARVQDDIGRGRVWVARNGGRVIGVVRARPLAGRQEAWEIYGLAVDPEYSQLDVGTSLVRAVEDRLRPQGVRALHLQTGLRDAPAIEFWYRVGYRPYRLDADPDPAGGYDRVWFAKEFA
ncbi:GNAT family N-acetyltransferase [Thermaerobacter subterraneus]|uniref:Acetyltransferase n=1 Tax=Thermaerobacter subterraneus DSM 13965 TaxID=867903 RepID=K6QC54_9FIRM|nr:GNAT family N-acetyltransferase [Thermaerobacter subterraneus]EKP94016.1 putative acetyltransferase [Thermaerobacter subterraneus DSM 13965]